MKAGTFSSKTLLGCLFFLVLAGCGGGGGGSETRQDTSETEQLTQGIFVDAGVSGLSYRSGPATGKTDAAGTFRYQVVSGEPQSVSFFLGGLELGSAIGQPVLTPIDILGASSTSDPRVINLLRLLQTLDEDGNPDNGIVLSESVQAQFTADTPLDLASDIFNGSEPLASIFDEVNKEPTDIVGPEEAREHFENSVVTGTGRQLYTLGGAASGLLGSVSLVLGDETLVIVEDAQFRFIGKMFDDTAYSVSVADSGTGQTCGLTNASGRIDGNNVTNIILQCEADAPDVYPVGGSVSGLSGEVRLVNNDSDELSITSDGAFQFTTPIASGSDFNVQITQQPSGQLCSLTGASGTISDAGVSSVLVSCADTQVPLFSVGGEIVGLTGSIGLSLNGGESLSFSGTDFSFPTGLEEGSAYTVAIENQPSGQQGCAIANATGTIVTSNIDDIRVLCATSQFSLGGNITGLSGAVTLNNGADSLVVSDNGSYTFGESYLTGTDYNVTVGAQPEGQTCSLASASGTFAQQNVTDVNLTCSDSQFSLAGFATGIPVGQSLQLLLERRREGEADFENAGTFELTNASGAFSSQLAFLDDYRLTIDAQPVSSTCLINNTTSATGENVQADVTSLNFSCQADTYDVTLNIAATDNQGLAVQLADLLSEGGDLNIAVDDDSPLNVTADETPILSSAPFPDAGYELRLTNSLVAANCSLADENSEGTLTILSSPVDKTNTNSNVYDVQVAAICAEKPQFSLSFQMEGVNSALIENPVVSVAINEEDPLVVAQGSDTPPTRTYYSGYELALQLSEILDGYGCAFTGLQAGEGEPAVIDPSLSTIEAFSIGSDLQYTIGCEGEPVPLNLVTSGIDKPFDVVLQVDGVQQSVTLDPVSTGATLLPLGNLAVGASLEGLGFESLPTGVANCALSDQAGLVSGGVLSGIMPLEGASLSSECGSSVSVAAATTEGSFIVDSVLRDCVQATVPANQSWDSVTELNCPADPNGGDSEPRITSLEGIERFVNLTAINFNDHAISNLDPLLSLLDLESVFLANNPLTLTEREKLNELDELNQTVFVSGSGTTADANEVIDVNYFASVAIQDSEIYVLDGDSKEIQISYDVEGCSESVFSEFSVSSKPIGATSYSFELDQSCGIFSSSVLIDSDSFVSRETRQAEFDFTFGGNLEEKDLNDQLYAEFAFIPVLIPETADTLGELFFPDANLAACLNEVVGSETTLVSDIKFLDLSNCSAPPLELAGLDLEGINQLKALESLDVGSLAVTSMDLLSELIFLESFSRSTTTSLTDDSWRTRVQDDQLLACIDSTIRANPSWVTWEDVTRVRCFDPVPSDLSSFITDLSGIEQFEQLSRISMEGHSINDGIGALRKLPILTMLELGPSSLYRDEWMFSAGQSSTSASRRNPRYSFTLDEALTVEIDLIDLNSTTVDPYLLVLDDAGTVIWSDDDGGPIFRDARVSRSFNSGTYEVIAGTFSSGQTGSFEISANVELTPVLKKLKTPVFADTEIAGTGSFALSGTLEGARETGEFAEANVEIELGMPPRVVFYEFDGIPQIIASVTASVESSPEGGGGSGGQEKFNKYGYRLIVEAKNTLGESVRSTPAECDPNLLYFSTSCFSDLDVSSAIAELSLAPGEYELKIEYKSFYQILEASSHTTSVDTQLVIFKGYNCLISEESNLAADLSGSFSSLDYSNCPAGTEIDLSGVDKFYYLESLDLSNAVVTAGMSNLLRVRDSTVVNLDGLKVDLSNPELLAEFIPDPALRQCVGDNLPEFYDPAIDTLTTLDCPGYGIYHLGGLEYLQTLRSVDLSDNLLDDNDVQVLKQLPLLAGTVDVTGNDLSFAAIAELQTYFAGGATFLPEGPAPVVPVPALTTSDNSFEVSWVTDPTVTRYDLLYRFEGESFDRTVTNASPPVVVSFPDTAVPYEVQVVVTNDLGSARGARVEGTP